MSPQFNTNRYTFLAIMMASSLFLLAATVTPSKAIQKEGGKDLYSNHCAKCHGEDGTKGMFGAKNLTKSTLSDSLVQDKILKGKRFMPSFKKRLTMEEIQSIAAYVKTLRH